MGQIIRIEGTDIYIQMSDQKVVKAPITAVNYPNPQVGDQISIIKNGNTMYIARTNAPAAAPAPQPQAQQYQQQQYQQQAYQQPSQPQYQQSQQTPPYGPKVTRMNKHVFAWVGNFLFGGLGVDRFMRGQVGLGILKLLTAGGFGVWTLIDFIIALTEVYGGAFGQSEEVVFVNGQYAK